MKMLRKSNYIIWGILLSIILLLISIEIIIFDLDNYKGSFVKYNVAEITGMEEMALRHVTEDILEYLKDNRQILDTRAIVRGKTREVFGDREKLHMADVKELFIKGKMFRNIGLALLAAMVLLFTGKDRYWRKTIPDTLLYTSVANIAFLAIFSALMQTNFSRYFNYFHIIFFDNNLWKLNPNIDMLIQMFPEGFFYDTAVKVISCFIILSIISGLSGLYLKRAGESAD